MILLILNIGYFKYSYNSIYIYTIILLYNIIICLLTILLYFNVLEIELYDI